MQSHICKVHACLAVTCHLHFWQNDRDLLRAAAVTRGWERYRNESAQKADPGRRNSPAAAAGIRTRDLLNHESGALTTELSLHWFTGNNTFVNIQGRWHTEETREAVERCILFLLRAAASIIFLVAAFTSLAAPSPSDCSFIKSQCFHVPGTGFRPAAKGKMDYLSSSYYQRLTNHSRDRETCAPQMDAWLVIKLLLSTNKPIGFLPSKKR